MGWGGIAGWTERLLGGKAADIGKELIKVGDTGRSTFDAGNALTDEGLGGLRNLNSTYQSRLANPLGSAAGIFSRARGALSDTATQRAGAFNNRLGQQAIQSGANLSPEARAQLEEQNQRDINQGLFEGNVAVSDAEAAMTLNETSKLFDRMENISKTILTAGESKATQGIQTILAALGLRYQRNAAIASTIVSSMGKGGINTGAGNQGSQPSGITGS